MMSMTAIAFCNSTYVQQMGALAFMNDLADLGKASRQHRRMLALRYPRNMASDGGSISLELRLR